MTRGQQAKREQKRYEGIGEGETTSDRAFGGRASRLAVFLCAHLLRIEQTRNKLRGREEMTKEVKRGQQNIQQKRKKATGNSEGQGGTSIERVFGGRACRLAVLLCAHFLRIEQTR